MNSDQDRATTDAVAHWESPSSSTGHPADCAWSHA
jgi:hypothetical protein